MVVDEGLKCILRFLLRDSALDAQIGLFSNAIEPDVDTVLADLTEASFPGYVTIPAVDLTWPDPAINDDGEAESDGPIMTWEATGSPGSPEAIHGLYVSIVDDESEESLFVAYAFPEPVTITSAGDQVQKKINWFTDQY